MNESEVKAYLQYLYDDFPYFYSEVARIIGGEEPGRARMDIAHFMQHGAEGEKRVKGGGFRRVVLAMRKIGKSFIAAAYDDWRLFRNAQEQVLHCSASEGLAKDTLHMERRWLDIVPFLKHLAPHGENQERDNIMRFDVATANHALLHSASVRAIGISGQLPGVGATLVRPDDVESPENTLTQDGRKLLRQRIEGFEPLTLSGGDILYLGTPQHEESIYRILPDLGYTVRAWPIVYPALNEEIPHLAPMIIEDLKSGRAKPGDPVFPEKMNSEQVALKRLRCTPATFAMQFMLRTDLLEKEIRPLRLDDLMVLDSLHRDLAPSTLVWGHKHQNQSTRLPYASVGFGDDGYYAPVMIGVDWIPYHGTKAALDPAGRGKDEMAWAIAGQLYGNLFLKYVGGVHGGATPDNLEVIAQSLRDHDARELTIETNFGGDFLVPLIEPVIRKFIVREGEDQRFPKGWSCAVLPIHSTGQKEKRIIDALAPVSQQHRLIISKSVAKDVEWARQYTHITTERGSLDHDDRLEASAMVVSAFKDVLYQDSTRISERKQKEAQIDQLRKLSAHFGPVRPPNWINLGF